MELAAAEQGVPPGVVVVRAAQQAGEPQVRARLHPRVGQGEAAAGEHRAAVGGRFAGQRTTGGSKSVGPVEPVAGDAERQRHVEWRAAAGRERPGDVEQPQPVRPLPHRAPRRGGQGEAGRVGAGGPQPHGAGDAREPAEHPPERRGRRSAERDQLVHRQGRAVIAVGTAPRGVPDRLSAVVEGEGDGVVSVERSLVRSPPGQRAVLGGRPPVVDGLVGGGVAPVGPAQHHAGRSRDPGERGDGQLHVGQLADDLVAEPAVDAGRGRVEAGHHLPVRAGIGEERGEQRREQAAAAVLGPDRHARDPGRRHRGTAEPRPELAGRGHGGELASVEGAPRARPGGRPRVRERPRGGPEGLGGEGLGGLAVVPGERADLGPVGTGAACRTSRGVLSPRAHLGPFVHESRRVHEAAPVCTGAGSGSGPGAAVERARQSSRRAARRGLPSSRPVGAPVEQTVRMLPSSGPVR